MKSVLVIGLGRFGRRLAGKMQELGNEVMVVDSRPELVERVSDKFTDAQIGDCTNESVIKALGVRNFDLCFVTIGEDFQSSLVITSLLKKHGARCVVSKYSQDIQGELLKTIGADEIVFPEREYAEKVAIRYNAGTIFDYIELTPEYAIYELPVPSDWVGRSIAAVNVRRKHRVNIIAIKSGDRLEPLPEAEYAFREDDHVVVIGGAADVFKLSNRQNK